MIKSSLLDMSQKNGSLQSPCSQWEDSEATLDLRIYVKKSRERQIWTERIINRYGHTYYNDMLVIAGIYKLKRVDISNSLPLIIFPRHTAAQKVADSNNAMNPKCSTASGHIFHRYGARKHKTFVYKLYNVGQTS